MAVVRAVEAGRIGVILVPTRALAQEIHRKLSRGWAGTQGPLAGRRLRVVLTTGEQFADDGAIRAGQVDVIVAVYEKFRCLIAQAPLLAARLGCVVADEIHLVADPQRGATVDLVLTGLLARDGAVQVVVLGGGSEDGEALSRWIGVEPFVWRERPGGLREGTLCLADGWFCYRTAEGSGGPGLERLLEGTAPADAAGSQPHGTGSPAHQALKALRNLAIRLTARGQSLMVFVPTRRVAREWACYLAAALAEDASMRRDTLPVSYCDIEAAEEGHGRRLLLECARGGVAFHSGDLSTELRTAVEEGFSAGEIPVLISTPTLAEGVNLGCANVVIVPPELLGVEGHTVPLDRRRLANMGGRAGRGGETSPETVARAMVLVADREQASAVWHQLLEPPMAHLETLDTEETLESMVLAVAVGLAEAREGAILARLLETFRGQMRWISQGSRFRERMDGALQRLVSWGLIEERESEGEAIYGMTACGMMACAHGLTPAAAQWLAAVLPAWPRSEEDARATELALLLTAAQGLVASDGSVPTPAPGSPRAQAIHGCLIEWLPEVVPALRIYRDSGRTLPAGELSAGIRALLALDWASGEPAPQLETRYRVFSGGLASVAGQLAHVLHGMADLAEILGTSQFPLTACQSLALRLPAGLPAYASNLAPLVPACLSRTDAILLAREGFSTLETLNEAQPGVLEGLLGPKVAVTLREEVCLRLSTRSCFGDQLESFHRSEPVVFVPQPHQPMGQSGQASRRHSGGNGKPGRRQSIISDSSFQSSVDPTLEVPTTDSQPLPECPSGIRLLLATEIPGFVRVDGQTVPLSPMAFHLLALLAARPGQVVSYVQIRHALWQDSRVGDQQVRFHKRKLAQALSAAGGEEWIQTRHGHGLILKLSPDQVWVRAGECPQTV
jgi:helicase